MIRHGRWMEHGVKKMYLIGDKGKIVAQIDCADYPMIWAYKNDKYISRESAQEAAEAAQQIVDGTFDGDFLTWAALRTEDGKIDYKMLGDAFIDLIFEVYAPYKWDKNMSPNRDINRLMNKAERDTQVKEFLESTLSRWAAETQSMRGSI